MDQKAVNVIKNLTLDVINNSGNGSIGISFGAAPIMYALFAKNLNVNPSILDWINRDRFVMSPGHGSALLYSTMFLSGYPFMIEDLKNYRKLNSKTPGNPDISTPGIEVTTGPLGQGFATSVGLALGEKILEEKYNAKLKNGKPDKKIGKLFDYNIYVLVSDGDLETGISYEAASFAGTHKLGNLIVLYDSNNISIDGNINKTFSENVLARFSSMGWDTKIIKNGSSVSEIDKAIKKAKNVKDKPSIIQIKTIIGAGSLKQGTNTIHDELMTKEDIEQFKEKIGAGSIPFTILKEPASYMRNLVVDRGNKIYPIWEQRFEEYKKILSQGQINEINNLPYNKLSIDLTSMEIPIDYENKELMRESNHSIMNILGTNIYNFIGGSCDVANITRTYIDDGKDLSPTNYTGKNISFGVRCEFMGACLNGLALTGFRPFGSTYLAFSDYLKTSIRMSSIMNLPVTYIFTNDSITEGSNGATYQPVEQLAMLRSTPNLYVFRPADKKELIGCWNYIINSKVPSVISLPKTEVKAEKGTNILNVSKGAYIAGKEKGKADAIIIATGSEVQLAKSIQAMLLKDNIDVRVISMPCMELFNEQNSSYKNELLNLNVPVFVIEYGSSFGFEKYVSSSDYLFNINNYGISASKDEILKYFKLDTESIINKIKSLLK